MITNRTGYALSSTVTRVKVDGINVLVGLERRRLQFLVESEPLTLGIRPVTIPVDGLEQIPEIDVKPNPNLPTGNLLAVGLDVEGLKPGQKLALVGKRPNVRVVDANTLGLRTTEFLRGTPAAALSPVPFIAEVQDLLQPPGPGSSADGGLKLDDPAGAREPLAGHTFELLEPLQPTDPADHRRQLQRQRHHPAQALAAAQPDRSRSGRRACRSSRSTSSRRRRAARPSARSAASTPCFRARAACWSSSIAACEFIYDRASLTISANVAAATNGETVANETLGSGDATVAQPVVHAQAAAADVHVVGRQSDRGGEHAGDPRERHPLARGPGAVRPRARRSGLQLRRTDDGQTRVIFGDGKAGARLPSRRRERGRHLSHRDRPGGEVDAGSLTLLSTRPLGIRSVLNPLAAERGRRAGEARRRARNAPLTVRTLDRVVSVSDVEDFAARSPGSARRRRGCCGAARQLVHLTVGEPTESRFPPIAGCWRTGGALLANGDPSLLILSSDRQLRAALVHVTLAGRRRRAVREAQGPGRGRSALLDAFSFARRGLRAVGERGGDPGASSRASPGVVAANVLPR